jgi:hypothetical protein
MVKSELQTLSTRHLRIPTLAEVETADLTIWSEEAPSLGLLPGSPEALSKGANFWKVGSNFVLGSAYVISTLDDKVDALTFTYSRFGAYIPSEQSPRVDCLLLVLVDLRCQYVQVTARTQKEDDILSFHGIYFLP